MVALRVKVLVGCEMFGVLVRVFLLLAIVVLHWAIISVSTEGKCVLPSL